MQSLFTTLLTTEELTTAAARLAPLWNPLFATQPLLGIISTAAEADRAAIIQAASRQAASDFTGPLKAADDTRDAAFTTLRDFSATWAKNPTATAEQRAAGDRLQAIFALHGNTLHRLGYNRQSGLMDALVADLKKPQSTADLTALNLAALFGQMEQAQTAFEDLAADKSATEGGETLPTIAQHRPLLTLRLNLLLDNIAQWETLAPTPELAGAIAKMDEVITTLMAPALARRTKAQAAPDPVPAPQ
ncbi:MAG: DUF6261 family protein [Luteolibacter sp.]|uniref:DUF6261 family protein n=1 Tax=Luteolibacter sp. TaxID=1962973 RepID=UPI00326784FE